MIVHNRSTSLAVPSISELRALFNGRVIPPDDPRYEKARTVFYGGIDRHPAAIVRVADGGDVSRLVSLARETGVELAIRSGGHSVVGFCTTEGGIVLDLSSMKDLQIDVANQTAWAEAGLTAGEVTTALAAHGLALGFGDTGSVGIGGITLGGGVGYLVRKYGLTIDSLLAAEIVTADGQLLHVDKDSHPDLFWAIRGGGGNFGVVTRFKFRVHTVDSVVGGMLILPATAEVIAKFMAEAEAAPDELSGIANVMGAPPMPFLPADVHGKLIVFAMLVYAGDVETGERVLARFRSIATPLADMMKPMKYPEIYPPEEGAEDYHPVAASRTMFVDAIDRSVAQTILDHLQSSEAMMKVAQLRVLGGAMARVPADATAFAHRRSKIMVNLAALYNQPEEKEKHETWVSNFEHAIRQSDHGVYVNFLSSEEKIHAAYPGGTWDKLVAVKKRYDPTNLFRLNQNIPPEG
jgi:FAD/FMN-containing dehydrogenase